MTDVYIYSIWKTPRKTGNGEIRSEVFPNHNGHLTSVLVCQHPSVIRNSSSQPCEVPASWNPKKHPSWNDKSFQLTIGWKSSPNSCLLETTHRFLGQQWMTGQGTKEPGLVHGEESPPENWRHPSPRRANGTKSSYVQKGLFPEKKMLQMMKMIPFEKIGLHHTKSQLQILQQSKGNTKEKINRIANWETTRNQTTTTLPKLTSISGCLILSSLVQEICIIRWWLLHLQLWLSQRDRLSNAVLRSEFLIFVQVLQTCQTCKMRLVFVCLCTPSIYK